MRVLIIGDSPSITTGFGRINKIAADMLVSQGHEVASLAALADEVPEDTGGIKYYLPTGDKGDIWGFRDITRVVGDFAPDLVYQTSDPGTFVATTQFIPATQKMFGYVPIEGEPISAASWRNVLSRVPFMTCSKYGVKIVKEGLGRDINYVYHGVDHDVFKPSTNRDEVRSAMGWDNKFVIMDVATNVRRKQIPRLIEAVSILKRRYHQADIVLYLHTIPFQGYWLDGWNLREVAAMYGVSDITVWHPSLQKMGDRIHEESGNPDNPGLSDLYGAADLFVNPSQVEGFSLPTAEAMACGLPVLVTKYAAQWEIASPAGRGIIPLDYEIHKSGTLYANVSPEAIAKEILRLKRNPKELARMSAMGIVRAQDYSWDRYKEKLSSSLEEVLSGDQVGSADKQIDDTPAQGSGSIELLSQHEGEDSVRKDGSIPEGQDETLAG